ncbi:unnamed protein product [Amaranthus hypochondriacus]
MDEEKSQVLSKLEAAKRMAAEKDYAGARSRLLELHNQFPGSKNITQMITVCDILFASELTTLDGQTDWYWVLQLSPAATISQLRLRYNKFTALLEGIKGEFPGTVSALKLVHDAYDVLSTPPKSLIFNSKRLTSAACDRNLNQELNGSLVCENTGSKDVEEGFVSVGERNLTAEIDDLEGAEVTNKWDKGIDSFEQNSVFSSVEATRVNDNNAENPISFGFSSGKSSVSRVTTGLKSEEDIYNIDGSKKGKVFEAGQIWAAYDSENLPRKYARINNVLEVPFRLDVTWLRPIPKTENEISWCEVRMPVVCGLFDLQEDENSVVDSTLFSHLVSCTANPTYDKFEILPQEDEVWAIYKNWKPLQWLKNPESRKGCSLQIVRVLEAYSDQEGVIVMPLIKVGGFDHIYKRQSETGLEGSFTVPANCLYQFSHQLPAHELEGGKLFGVYGGISEQDVSTINLSTSQSPVSHMSSLNTRMSGSLKAEWTSEDVAASQVWALYDGFDKMPRIYAVVNKVFSSGAVEVTFLEPIPNPMDNEEISWMEENLPVGCGIFKLGSRVSILPLNTLSHMVNSDRTTKNMLFRIYPKKGEIWAMYKNWNIRWKLQNLINCHCRIVEVISDFTDPFGISTASLEEVPGFKTFYRKQLSDGFALNRVIPRSEMLSFSHRIEAFVVPGIEAHGIPECSWHLEPDALPTLVSK